MRYPVAGCESSSCPSCTSFFSTSWVKLLRDGSPSHLASHDSKEPHSCISLYRIHCHMILIFHLLSGWIYFTAGKARGHWLTPPAVASHCRPPSFPSHWIHSNTYVTSHRLAPLLASLFTFLIFFRYQYVSHSNNIFLMPLISFTY